MKKLVLIILTVNYLRKLIFCCQNMFTESVLLFSQYVVSHGCHNGAGVWQRQRWCASLSDVAQADWLRRILARPEISDRDYRWSLFFRRSYSQHTRFLARGFYCVVNRLSLLAVVVTQALLTLFLFRACVTNKYTVFISILFGSFTVFNKPESQPSGIPLPAHPFLTTWFLSQEIAIPLQCTN